MVDTLNKTPHPEGVIGMQVYFQAFLNVSLDGSKCSAPSPAGSFPA